MDLMYMQNETNRRLILPAVSIYLAIYVFTVFFKGIIQRNNAVGYYITAVFIVTMCHLIISYKRNADTLRKDAKRNIPSWLLGFMFLILFDVVLFFYEFKVKQNYDYIDFVECLLLGILLTGYLGVNLWIKQHNKKI